MTHYFIVWNKEHANNAGKLKTLLLSQLEKHQMASLTVNTFVVVANQPNTDLLVMGKKQANESPQKAKQNIKRRNPKRNKNCLITSGNTLVKFVERKNHYVFITEIPPKNHST